MSPGGLLGPSWGLMWPIWEPSGGHLGAILGASGPSESLVGAFPGRHGSLLTILKHVREEPPSTSHDSTTSLHPSTWPGGMREAA